MSKTRYFLEKNCKNLRSVEGSISNPSLASSGWGSAPNLVLLFSCSCSYVQTLGSNVNTF